MLSHVGERLSDQVFGISRILLLNDERQRELGMLEDCQRTARVDSDAYPEEWQTN